ncbi:MAG: hypothetical protein ABIJ21_04540 [Nanoarchaeota archaeon]
MTKANNWKRVYDTLNLQKTIDDFRRILHDLGTKTKDGSLKTGVHEALTLIHTSPAYVDIEHSEEKKPTITIEEFHHALKELFDEMSEATKKPDALIHQEDKMVDTLKLWKKLLDEEEISDPAKAKAHHDGLRNGLSSLNGLYDLLKGKEIPLLKKDCAVIVRHLKEAYHPRDTADEKRNQAFIRFFEGLPAEFDNWVSDMEKPEGPMVRVITFAEKFDKELKESSPDLPRCNKAREHMAKVVQVLFVGIGKYDRLREELLVAVPKIA